jgi:hypothetical protein
MPYWDVVTRSFSIVWRHKYLWLIALFSGEAGTGFSFSYWQPSNRTADVGSAQQQVSTWLNDHAGLLVAIAVVWFVLVVAFFILAAICEGATVRASAEHDADRPFGLRQAWTMGVHTMWVIVRFRLLLVALYLPLVVLLVAWLAGLLVALINNDAGAIFGLAVFGLLLVLVWLVYATYLFFLDRLGSRAIVLEERKAIAALGRAHRLLFKRLGRTLLVWLLSIAVAIVIGIILACFGGLIAAPLFIAAAFAASSGQGIAWPLVVLAAIVFLPISLLVAGFTAAQGSTYWTLAFRRLDVDYYAPVAYPYPAIPPAPPAPQG